VKDNTKYNKHIGHGWQLFQPETIHDRMQLTPAPGTQWTNPTAHREQSSTRWLVLRSIHAGPMSHDDDGRTA
jgi:hypothetical protein